MRLIRSACVWLVAIMLVALTGSTTVAAASGPTAGASGGSDRVVAGYFANWGIYDRGYFPRDIPAGQYTHINYAFASPSAAGACASLDPWADYQRPFSAAESVDGVADTAGQPLKGNFNQFLKLKQAHPRLKTVISVGGWTDSKYFSDVALTAQSRRTFVRSCINRFIVGNLWPADGSGGMHTGAGVFDGIDIDWEFPATEGNPGNHIRPEDRHDATLLFKEFRRQLDVLGATTGKHYLLTAAIPGGNVAAISYELPKVSSILDWINMMTYDLHGTWESKTNFNSPFGTDPADPTTGASHWTVEGSVRYFLAHGVPADKLVVGVPFYGVQWIRAGTSNHGLYQPYDNTGLDASYGWKAQENPAYRDLVDIGRVVTSPSHGSTPAGRNGYTRYWNDQAGEPWLWKAHATRAGETVSAVITYDDPASIAERVSLVKAKGLRGLMCWELSLDSNANALSKAMAKVRH